VKVGYFHFGCKHDDPIGELRSSLSAARTRGTIDGSVIVLPEGFNIGTFYAIKNAQCDFDPDILPKLMVLSKTYDVNFVAGVIIRELNGPQPPFSSAYLVDDIQCRLICRKHLADDYTDHYTPCEGDFDIAQPIEHAGSRIAALICIDFSDGDGSERVENLKVSESFTLLCVPACSKRILKDDSQGYYATKDWPNKIVALANSHPKGKSLMTDRNGCVVSPPTTGACNEVVVADLG